MGQSSGLLQRVRGAYRISVPRLRGAIILLFFLGMIHALPAHADSGASDCYMAMPEWGQAADMHSKLEAAEGVPDDTKDALESRFAGLQDRHDAFYDGTAAQCQELRQFDSDKSAYEGELAQYTAEFNAHQQEAAQQHSECGGTVDSQEEADRCNEWGARIDADKQRLDEWAARLQDEVAAINRRADELNRESASINAEWKNLLDSYVTDAQSALDDQGFTGKKVYRLTAKTWIDASDVTEPTLRGVKFKLQGNNKPNGPYLNGDNDFKLYQAFNVEVIFEKGKVKHAQFLKDSLQQRVGSTYMFVPALPVAKALPFQGVINVTDQRIVPAADNKSVKFIRTVEGRPNLMILFPDYFDPVASTNFATIYNTLEITVTVDDPEVEGRGSNFPSHMFWLGDQLFHEQQQEQPSEFFAGH